MCVDRIYLIFDHPGVISGSKTLLTGIHEKDNDLYITGFYEAPSTATIISFLYRGDLTGKTGSCSNNS